MRFDLDKELTDLIIFGMENQGTDFYLDTRELSLVTDEDLIGIEYDGETEEAEGDGEDRFLSIPEWRSVNGYNLMEKFVASLHNPIFREKLRNILASGRGVFRQFKDTVKERPEIERLWYSFKEREMRDVVRDWYNGLREQWGLERLELHDVETEQLILSDFVFSRDPVKWMEEISRADKASFADMFGEQGDSYVDWAAERSRRLIPPPDDPASLIITAETLGGDFAGFAWGVSEYLSDGRMLFLLAQLYVIPEYRGLGLGTELFERLTDAAYVKGADRFELSCFGSGKIMEGYLERCGFEPLGRVFGTEMRSWHRKNRE
jgi:GNAT superfamily N-acetyltransferase